jgi:hypothetical protein
MFFWLWLRQVAISFSQAHDSLILLGQSGTNNVRRSFESIIQQPPEPDSSLKKPFSHYSGSGCNVLV